MKLKPLACLMGLGLTTPAWAIGLGDLTVHSHLGQPLHATVEVLGAPANLEAACFSLRPADNGVGALPQARFRVEPRGKTVLLHITTPRPVNDPVAQFVLGSDCEGRLQREYVVLLDPPVEIQPVRIAVETSDVPVAAVPAARAAAAPAASVAVRATPEPGANSPSSTPTATAEVQAPARSAPPPRKAAAKPAAKADARLVISGSKADQAGKLPAGPETESAPPPSADSRTVGLSPTELSDENTALSRRLAHLEAQLAALHQRNAELEARLAASRLTQPEATPEQAPRWPLYLLGLGLLGSGGLLAAWMRRRSPAGVGKGGPEIGAPLPPLDTVLDVEVARSKPSPVAVQESEEQSLTALADGTDVREDILDQAEVYVAHGYSNLAINLLQEHVKIAPTESPVPWMLLLDLLRREGDVAGYAEASAECRRHFNVRFPDLPGAHDPYDNRGLESYPHVLQMLTVTWNSPDLFDVFRDLIYDQRGGVRTGFEPSAYRDILLLRAIAEQKSLAMAA